MLNENLWMRVYREHIDVGNNYGVLFFRNGHALQCNNHVIRVATMTKMIALRRPGIVVLVDQALHFLEIGSFSKRRTGTRRFIPKQ